MSTEQIERIEANIREARETVKVSDALVRLRGNKDFKEVVLSGYFEKEAVRLVHLKADPSMESDTSQKSIIAQMDAIGCFSQYLTTVVQLGNLAHKQIHSDEAMVEELQMEEAQ